MSPCQGSVAQRRIHVAGYENPTPTLETEKYPIEQGHNPRRNARARRDPRVKYLGFTSRQWPLHRAAGFLVCGFQKKALTRSLFGAKAGKI